MSHEQPPKETNHLDKKHSTAAQAKPQQQETKNTGLVMEQTNDIKEIKETKIPVAADQFAPVGVFCHGSDMASAIEIKAVADQVAPKHNLWFKITNLKENHNGLQYQDGLVTLKPGEKFARVGAMGCAGRLYYTDQEHIAKFYSFGVWLRVVEIPKDAQTVLDQCGTKWGADKLILKERYSLYDPKTYEKFGLRMQDNQHLLNWALTDGNIEFLEKWGNDEEPYNQLKWNAQEHQVASLPISSVAWWYRCNKSARPTTFSVTSDILYKYELVDHLQAIFVSKNKNRQKFVEWWGESKGVVATLILNNKKRGLQWVLTNQIFPITREAVQEALHSHEPIYYLDALMNSGQAFEFPPNILHGFYLSTKPAILQWIKSKGLEINPEQDKVAQTKIKESPKEIKEKSAQTENKESLPPEIQKITGPKGWYDNIGKNFMVGVLCGGLTGVVLCLFFSKIK